MNKNLNKLEHEVLGAMRLICKKWHGSDLISAPDIEVGHTLEGVQCNGDGRRCSMYKAVVRFQSEITYMHDSIHTLNTAIDEFESAVRMFTNHYKICPECEGEQGAGDSGKHTENGWPYDECWHDCANCDGKGYAPK